MIKDLAVLSEAGLFISCADVPSNFHKDETQKEILQTAKRLGVSLGVMVADVPSKMDVMGNFLRSRQVIQQIAPGDVLIVATNDPMGIAHDPMATTRCIATIKSAIFNTLVEE